MVIKPRFKPEALDGLDQTLWRLDGREVTCKNQLSFHSNVSKILLTFKNQGHNLM